MTADAEDVLDQATRWRNEGHEVALATVVRTWGSSPRQPGSRLVVSDAGTFVGSVSGGCIEAAVVREALAIMSSGVPRLLDFGVTSEMAWEVGLACGGEVQVFVEVVGTNAALLEQLQTDRAAHRPTVLATRLPTGEQLLLYPREPRPQAVSERLFVAALDHAARDTAGQVEENGAQIFLHPFNPPLRLIVVGAVHVAQPLARMAALTGFAVVVVDPRAAFCTAERFPGVERCARWPDEALASLSIDTRTAVVTLTHDPKLDDPALETALRSPAFYIGCLGSRKTHASRKARLMTRGFDELDLERLHGPVGLAINALTPAEVALSIVAQIVQTLRPEKARHEKPTVAAE